MFRSFVNRHLLLSLITVRITCLGVTGYQAAILYSEQSTTVLCEEIGSVYCTVPVSDIKSLVHRQPIKLHFSH